jgi:hypothetical protein
MSFATKQTAALAFSGLVVITMLWLSLYVIGVQNRSWKEARAENRSADAAASFRDSNHR